MYIYLSAKSLANSSMNSFYILLIQFFFNIGKPLNLPNVSSQNLNCKNLRIL